MTVWGNAGPTGSASGVTPPVGIEPRLVSSMPCLARVLVLSQDKAWSRDISKRLRRNGYATFTGEFSVVARKLTRDEHPDIVIVGVGDTPGKALELARALKSDADSAHIPVVLMAPGRSAALPRHAVGVEVDDILVGSPADDVLIARLRPLVRLATMYNELRNRAATAHVFRVEVGSDVKPARAEAPFKVIAVAENERDFAEVEALGGEFEVARAVDVFDASNRLHRGAADALVIQVRERGEDALYLCGQIRNNAALFNLPVLLVADTGGDVNDERAYLSGASIVIPRPLDHDEIVAATLMLVRRQRLRQQIRSLLAGIHRGRLRDELESVFSRAFLTAHLERLAVAAQCWRKHLSVVCFQVQNLHWVAREHGDAAANDLLRQVAEWIATLVRVEDLVARNGPKEFCVVLPESSLDDAQVVAHRLSGILLNTEFAVKGVADPVGAWIQAGIATLSPGETASGLIERAHRNLR
jgi:two-component system cell cycle response regulator